MKAKEHARDLARAVKPSTIPHHPGTQYSRGIKTELEIVHVALFFKSL